MKPLKNAAVALFAALALGVTTFGVAGNAYARQKPVAPRPKPAATAPTPTAPAATSPKPTSASAPGGKAEKRRKHHRKETSRASGAAMRSHS